MSSITTKNVLFVTGAFVTHHSWDEWVAYFNGKGYNAINPPWPHKDGTVTELRNRQPNDVALATLTLSQLIDHYANIAKSFSEKPIIIGHSLGGLITQVLLNRDLAAAAVTLHSVPTLGVFPYEYSFLKAGWRSLGLFTSVKKTYLMSFKTWQYAFVNGMSLTDQQHAYDISTIPESKTVARGGLTKAAAVDYNKPHAPYLMTAGSNDHIIPPHLNYRNYKRYKKDNGSILDYKEFPGRNHYVVNQPTWKENADYVIDWLRRL